MNVALTINVRNFFRPQRHFLRFLLHFSYYNAKLSVGTSGGTSSSLQNMLLCFTTFLTVSETPMEYNQLFFKGKIRANF